MQQKSLPSWEYLNDCFNYDPETGILCWKRRPEHHFKSASAAKAWNSLHSGAAISCVNKSGYLVLTLDSKNHYAHRIIHKLLYRKDPDHHIDHINGVKSDNKQRNLREATHSGNMRNRGVHSDNVSGYKGVTFRKNCSVLQYGARILVDGVTIDLGSFTTAKEASEAYIAAAKEYHGEFSYF